MNEDYYYSMIEQLRELLEDYDKRPDDDFIKVAQSVNVDSLYNIPLNSHITLYRARYNTGFDDTDPSQFSYIHNVNIISRQRYNKAHEQVLYTATNPSTAYEEIEQPGNSGPFYLSVWTSGDELTYSFLYNPQNCIKGSNAERFTGILYKKVAGTAVGDHYHGMIGQLMEHEGTNYSFSSELASRIFKSIDALVSVSVKSDGKELNITFRKEAVDNAVKMHYVLLCDKMDNVWFHVEKIGLLEGNSVVWYHLELDDASYKSESGADGNTDHLWTYIKKNPLKFSPAAIDSIKDNRVFMLVGDKEKPVFSYSYKIRKL